ncbi:mechanosensitive ion channel domain-containing protein [Mycobacterium spongiae]|uniref:Mechanosensitive ion channel n=1 Tax=Mycobacterium spongiae TaxID=886343 RepID=A0A975JYX5_9MYCO|nr:mechanosensitive ion channel family protein [Mycobacterium spongiae]QUR68267.1 mechanosensitive ion channel [Mycobacterium spongiae]
MNPPGGSWFYWAIGVAVGLPAGLIILTEWHHALVRRQSYLAGPVNLLRNYLLPLAALLALLVGATQVPTDNTWIRIIATLFAFTVLVLALSGLNATLFQGAPTGSWRKRLPGILVDVARLLLIGVGLALILSYIWGIRIGGLFTALGVGSLVVGLMLQNSVGQVVSGLFLLFERPFGIGDWLMVATTRGQVVEVNWRAVHIAKVGGLEIIPNSVLAGTSFTNLSRPDGPHDILIVTTFLSIDPPDRVCALLSRVASALPQLKPGVEPSTLAVGTATTWAGGATQYSTSVGLNSATDAFAAKSDFLRWIWYAARREGLHLDGAYDDFSTPERIEAALRDIVGPALRLTEADRQSLIPQARMVRYGADEAMQHLGEVPTRISFVVAGSIRLTATDDDGLVVTVGTLYEGSFLGLTTLTRQPSFTGAYALEEVTALELNREHIEELVTRRPALLQDFARIIDEYRNTVSQLGYREGAQRGRVSGRER